MQRPNKRAIILSQASRLAQLASRAGRSSQHLEAGGILRYLDTDKPMQAHQLPCPECGASTPILGPVVNCLYCLADVQLPTPITATLAEHQHLKRQLDHRMREFERARGGMTSVSMASFAIGIVVALTAASAAILGYYQGGKIDHNSLPVIILMGFVYVGLIVGFVGGGIRSTRLTRRRLAVLPFAALNTSDALLALCSKCGGALAPRAHEVAVACPHCATESLLPAAMVEQRLQSKHRAIIDLKRTLGDAMASSTQVANHTFGYIFIGIGTVAGLAITAYLLFIVDAPHLQGAQRWAAGIIPGVFVGGIFAGAGILSIRKS